MGGLDIFNISERVSGWMMLVFAARTVILFGGVFLIWKGLTLLWEIRPVRRKKFTSVVTARVTELNQESRSASMNTYWMPRFEYEQDGVTKAFSPKEAYRPCRLKLGSEVTLCLADNGKFRTVRSEITLLKALLPLIIGAVMTAAMIFF